MRVVSTPSLQSEVPDLNSVIGWPASRELGFHLLSRYPSLACFEVESRKFRQRDGHFLDIAELSKVSRLLLLLENGIAHGFDQTATALWGLRTALYEAACKCVQYLIVDSDSKSDKIKALPINSGHPFFSRKAIGYSGIVVAESFGHLLSICASIDSLLLQEIRTGYSSTRQNPAVDVTNLKTRPGAVLEYVLSRFPACSGSSGASRLSSPTSERVAEELEILGLSKQPDLHLKELGQSAALVAGVMSQEIADAALTAAAKMAIGAEAFTNQSGKAKIKYSSIEAIEKLVFASPDGAIVVSGYALVNLSKANDRSRAPLPFDALKTFPVLALLSEVRVDSDPSEDRIVVAGKGTAAFDFTRLTATTPGRIRQGLRGIIELRTSMVSFSREAVSMAFAEGSTITWTALSRDSRIVTNRSGAIVATSLEHLIAMTIALHDIQDLILARARIFYGCDLRDEFESVPKIRSMRDFLQTVGLGSSYSFALSNKECADTATLRRDSLRALLRACGFTETLALEDSEVLFILEESSSSLKNRFHLRYLSLMDVSCADWADLDEISASRETPTTMWTRGYFANSGLHRNKRALVDGEKAIAIDYTPTRFSERSSYAVPHEPLRRVLEGISAAFPSSAEGGIYGALEKNVVFTDSKSNVIASSLAQIDIARRELETASGGYTQFSPRWRYDLVRYEHFPYGIAKRQRDPIAWSELPDAYLNSLPSSGEVSAEAAHAAVIEAICYLTGERTSEPFSPKFLTVRRFICSLGFKAFGAKKIVRGSHLLKAAFDQAAYRGREIPGAAKISGAGLAIRTVNDARITLYQQIFEDLEVPTTTVFLALVALGYLKETRRSFKNFSEFILRERDRASGSEKQNPRKRLVRELFQQFVDLHSSDARAAIASEGKGSLRLFLQQLCYRYYNGDHTAIIGELRSLQSDPTEASSSRELAIQILHEIVPPLIKRYDDIRKFNKPGSIIFDPLDHQIEAALAGRDEEKPLFLFDPGAGKTEAAALWTQLIESSFLYLTKGSLVSTTAQRLRNDCLRQKRIVSLSECEVSSFEELAALLESVDGLVMSYDRLRSIERRYPDWFKIIVAWVAKGALVCDEVHEIGNCRTRRFKTICNLKAARVLVMTATPFRHTPARVAGVLHIALPHLYPDPLALEHKLTDRSVARAYTLRHATAYSLNEIAATFKPFSEVPPEEQLKLDIPHIPAVTELIVRYPLSPRNTRQYIDRATSFKKWAKRYDYPTKGPAQFTALTELEYTDELVEAALIRALAVLEQGEKIVLACERLAPLYELSVHPLLAPYRPAYIRGSTPAKRRREIIEDIGSRDGPAILVGQIQALGSGFDMPWAREIVSMGRPGEVAKAVQLKGRNVRVRTIRHVNQCLDQVRFVYLTPELDKTVVAQVKDDSQRKLVRRGTVYDVLLDRLRERVEDLKGYTLRFGPPSALQISSTKAAVTYLEERLETLKRKRATYSLLSDSGLEDHFERHGSAVKEHWRTEYYGSFLRNNIKLVKDSPASIQAINLCGPLGLDTATFLEAGIAKKHLTLCEADPNPRVRALARATAERHDVLFEKGRVEAVLSSSAKTFGVIGIDLDGYWLPALVSALINLPIDHRVMILKNATRQRERGEAKVMTEIWDNDRRRLDLEILRLCGSSLLQKIGVKSPAEGLRFSRKVQDLATILSRKVARVLEADHISVRDFIVHATLRTCFFVKTEQMEYRNDNNKPLLSTFAVLQKPDDSTHFDEDLSTQLRVFLRTTIESDSASGTAASASLDQFALRIRLGKSSVIVNRKRFVSALECFTDVSARFASVETVLERPLSIVR